jgi:hypothetical protein
MKKSFAALSIVLLLFLSGCLAHMRATNVATNLNSQAARQESPYRWYVVDLEGDKAAVEQRLIGDVTSSKATDSKKQAILSKLEEVEAKNGRTTRLRLKEVRILPSAFLIGAVIDSVTSKVIEAWVLDSGGKEVVYTIEHVPGTKDEEFKVKGPWEKRS